MKDKRGNSGNKGFSLIEIIVAIAILAVVSSIVLYFITAGLRGYSREGTSVNLQYEAQLAMNQVSEHLIDANQGIEYILDNSTMAKTDTGSPSRKDIRIYNRTVETAPTGLTEKYICSGIEWIEADQNLYYYEYEVNRDINGNLIVPASDVIEGSKSLLAEHVVEFSADFSKLESNNYIKVKMGFQIKNEDFHTDKTIALRNNVWLNEEVAANIAK